jgi:DNA polymerase III, alpha subunit (gram-positive type)
MNYVVMDLEWNQSITKYRATRNGVRLSGEIVEIGAVRVNGDMEVIEQYCEFVKPECYQKMQHNVKELTEITNEMIAGGRPFKEVITEFLEWCGEDAFLTWSENDIIMIEDNMLFHGMEIDGLPKCYDVQLLFDDQVTQEDRPFALSYAMWKFDIRPQRSHDALNDALNTVEVLKRLDLSEGFEGYEI